jgi:hypothetical protein
MVKDHHHLHWAEDCEIIVLEETAIPEMEAPSPNEMVRMTQVEGRPS